MSIFLLDDSRMVFDVSRPAPKDRSIFRKNIGRALLNRENDEYLTAWNIDFTKRINRDNSGRRRDIQKEMRIESRITNILRERFGFRFLILEDEVERMGSRGLESSLIGTVASCQDCRASASWLGNSSPVGKIIQEGLWQVQHLNSSEIIESDREHILRGIERTIAWLSLS